MRIDPQEYARRTKQARNNGGADAVDQTQGVQPPAPEVALACAANSGGSGPSPDKPAPDWERIKGAAAEILAAWVGAPAGDEVELVRLFLEQEATGHHDGSVGTGPNDTIVSEQGFRVGRADLVVYHVDGSATVIEAKDGSRGYNHVVAGIGQASLHAVQLADSKGAVKRVRRALFWSSTADIETDLAIEAACEVAGVIPMAWPSLRVLMANVAAVRRVMEAAQ